MHVRVVRFTGVDEERLDGMLARLRASEGPPPGVPATGIKVLTDREQGTVVVLQSFATAEDMAAGDEVLGAMDPSDTPGTRASVDRCELAVERSPGDGAAQQ